MCVRYVYKSCTHIQAENVDIGLLRQSSLVWTTLSARSVTAADLESDREDGARTEGNREGGGTHTDGERKGSGVSDHDGVGEGEGGGQIEGWVLVSVLRKLFRISTKNGVGVGDSGSVCIGGEEVCSVRVQREDREEAGAQDDAEYGKREAEAGEEEVALTVIIKATPGARMTPLLLEHAILQELGLRV